MYTNFYLNTETQVANNNNHIGKRSESWQFVFRVDTKHGINDTNDLRALINKFGVKSSDNKTMTGDEFWKMVNNWNNDPSNTFGIRSERGSCRIDKILHRKFPSFADDNGFVCNDHEFC